MPPYCPSRDHWETKPPADLGLDPDALAVASAPGAFRVRVWEVMSRGRGPRGGCLPPEGVDVACPLAPMMTLTLSCDHRAVDGARGAQFLGALADLVEEPLALLA